LYHLYPTSCACTYALNPNSFVKPVNLTNNKRVKIGRQTNARTIRVPAENTLFGLVNNPSNFPLTTTIGTQLDDIDINANNANLFPLNLQLGPQ